jgi:phosphoenolpyruvate synthase/pyruvate phosphate dikinase
MLVEYEEGIGGVVDGESNSKMLFLDKDSYKKHNDLPQFYPIYIEAKRLENNYRSPVDIEWAIGKDNTAYILQVRPVTTKVKV